MASPINSTNGPIHSLTNLTKSVNDATEALAKQAAAKRLENVADDAAGLAIAENLDAEQRSLAMGRRNANDGLSLLQHADGAAERVSDQLARMKELAVQASSETLSDEQRSYIQTEIEQIQAEITRTANTTEFNGRTITTGQTMTVQTGSSKESEIDLNLGDLRADSLGVDPGSLSMATASEARDALGAVDNAISSVNEMRAENGSSQNTLESTINNLNTYTENLSSAESAIRDANTARKTAEMMKALFQQEANIAVQAQANALTQGAFQLLG